MYLLSVTCLGLLSLLQVLRILAPAPHGQGYFSRPLRALIWCIAGLAVMLPCALSIFDGFAFSFGRPVALDRPFMPAVWASSAAAIGLASHTVSTLVRAYRNSEPVSFLNVGSRVAALAACAVVATAGVKQIDFAAGDTGFANLEALHELGLAKGLHCSSGLIVVKWDDAARGQGVLYRCPSSVVLNQLGRAPFAPWPDYTEGRSDELGQALQQIRATSK